MQHASPLVRRICALAMLCTSRPTHVRGENTAFVIAGQCRANPKGLKLCRERGAVLQQFASYKRFVFDSLRSSPSSDGRNHPGRDALFLMMKDTLPAFPDTPSICAAIRSDFEVACVSVAPPARVAAKPSLVSATHVPHAKTPGCYPEWNGRHFPGLGDIESGIAYNWWGSMRLCWRAVVKFEAEQQQVQSKAAHGTAPFSFDRVVFTRPDITYWRSLGTWEDYPGDWYSGPRRFPDMLWLLRRAAAARVLGETYDTFLECAAGDACCGSFESSPSHYVNELWFQRGIGANSSVRGCAELAENTGSHSRIATNFSCHPECGQIVRAHPAHFSQSLSEKQRWNSLGYGCKGLLGRAHHRPRHQRSSLDSLDRRQFRTSGSKESIQTMAAAVTTSGRSGVLPGGGRSFDGSGGSLTVLFDVVFNNDAIAPGAGDPRMEVIVGMGRELRRRGHRVLLGGTNPSAELGIAKIPTARRAFAEFDRPTDENGAPFPDCALFWSNFSPKNRPSKTNAYNISKAIWGTKGRGNGRTPFLVYENGFTAGSVVVDPRGLLGDSFFVENLNEIVQKGYDAAACEKYIAQHLLHDSSKRPQQTGLDIPLSILGRFVFVPTQKFADISITKFSATTYPEMLTKAMVFCREHGFPLVVKIHPHLVGEERRMQAKLISKLDRDIRISNKLGERHAYARVYESKSSINLLTKHALFTVTLNGGTLMDNFFTTSPVLTLARSLFQKTDAVIASSDMEEGLRKMRSLIVTVDGGASDAHPLPSLQWDETRRERQRQIVCWYERSSLNWNKSAAENLEVLENHFAYSRAPLSFARVH